jgi:CubicO group peptidase (beta-lactamase class C family)
MKHTLLATLAALSFIWLPEPVAADQPAPERQIQELIPSLEDYIAKAMKSFDVPGLAIGIVAGDRLVYAKGFGVKSKEEGGAVDPSTIFQVGSTTKAFLATTIAIAVDRGKLRWDDRVVDLDPDFQLKDAWVTREFRVFDLLAQRSGLPPYANDALALFGLDATELIRSLRFVEPVSSFRSTFAYTNITHILAGRILARLESVADWNAILKRDLLDPLGMKESSYTAAAIEASANHAEGYRFVPDGSVATPFEQLFPYDFFGAGDINSNIEEMSRWVRLNLANGTFEGRRIVSGENLAVTRIARVGLNDHTAYAMGWALTQTPNGTVVWHNGGTSAFGAYVGLQLDRKIAVIVLSNQQNVGLPDAIGAWTVDRLMGNPPVDYAAEALKRAKLNFADADRLFAKPANPRPFLSPAPLAGNFTNPGIGKAVARLEGDALVLEIVTSGARLKLDPWDGDIFTATLMPEGRFAAMAANLGPRPSAFAQLQIDTQGKLNLLRLSFDDGQAYEFRRE